MHDEPPDDRSWWVPWRWQWKRWTRLQWFAAFLVWAGIADLGWTLAFFIYMEFVAQH